MSKIFTPTNQIRLTNVAVVRMKKGGKRFEIACYKNKVVAWRSEAEKDIDEVLQIHSVFINVSKGQVAKKEDLVKSFGTDDVTEVCKKILAKGELQVSDKERQSQMDQLFKEIAAIVSDKCLNPEVQKPYPVSIIEKSMRDMHFAPKVNQPPKQQALQVIKKLKETMPIERGRIRMRFNLQGKTAKKVRDRISKIEFLEIENEVKEDDAIVLTIVTDPGRYKDVEKLLDAEAKGTAIEVLTYKQMVEGAEHL